MGILKGLLKFVVAMFVLAIVLGVLNDDGSDSSSTNTVQASEPQREIFETTARQLFTAYEDNEVAADEQMKGKIISVKGIVQSIDKDFTDSFIVQFRTGNEFMPASMRIVDDQKAAVMELKRGQVITVHCDRMARVIGSPAGYDCEIQ